MTSLASVLMTIGLPLMECKAAFKPIILSAKPWKSVPLPEMTTCKPFRFAESIITHPVDSIFVACAVTTTSAESAP